MKHLYDQEIFGEEFLIKWNNRKLKLDRTCALNDRKSEKKFKEQIAKFIEWLETAEEDEDEEDEDDDEEETKKEETKATSRPQESEGQRKQRELIEKQKQEQQKMIDAKKEEANKAAIEKDGVADTTERLNVMDIKVDDDFDVDDI